MNYKQIKAIENRNKERLLKVNGSLDEQSGIYFLLRKDENGFKYAYIGQAKHILTRLSQHLAGYKSHIDASLRKRGLYDAFKNEYGWNVYALHFPLEELDEKETQYIKQYADAGYQLLNKTSGGQGAGKSQIAEYKPAKTYRDGVQQGRRALAKELNHIAEKHLTIELKAEKKANKVSQKAFEKFKELLKGENYEKD